MSGGTYVWMPLPAEPEPVNLPCPEDCGDYPDDDAIIRKMLVATRDIVPMKVSPFLADWQKAMQRT